MGIREERKKGLEGISTNVERDTGVGVVVITWEKRLNHYSYK